MGGAQSTSCIAVEELVEPQIILPMRIEIHHVIAIVDSSATVVVPRHEMLKTVLNLFGNVAQMHKIAGASRTFDLEVGPIKHVESLQ